MMTPFLTPTSDEQRRFLISFLFAGELRPGTSHCVARAYLDLCRTAHGIGGGSRAPQLKRTAHLLVESLLKEALHPRDPWTSVLFDEWHRRACSTICSHYKKGGYPFLCAGQAQKWMNMSIKYALSLAALEMLPVENAVRLRRVAHVPIDNIILDALRPLKPPRLRKAWSRVEDYDVYLELQRWIRKTFADSLPLDVEFHLWIKESSRQRRPTCA